MERKEIRPKLLMCAVVLSAAVAGIFGSVPLPVKAAEEGDYTVTFEACEGTCETENISVRKGESIILPEASYTGHYLEGWADAAGDMDGLTIVGRAGDAYTPERDMRLYADWKPEAEPEEGLEPGTELGEELEPEAELEELETGLKEELEAESEEELELGTESEKGLEPGTELEEELEPGTELEAELEPGMESEEELEAETEQKADISYEARIGEDYYENIESAFENAQEGDTITVLKDCSASKTLVASAGGLTLASEDAGKPVTISRNDEFEGKNYHKININNVLLGIEGSLTVHDIILDGGAELDGSFNNAGQSWDGPMVYVAGVCTMEDGTVLQNNYNAGNEGGSYNAWSAGALHVEWGGTLNMAGGLIHHCYTNGAGGGIQSGGTSNVTITAGTVRDCYARVGGAMELFGTASVSGMAISNNRAEASAVAIHGEVTLSGCLIENNAGTGESGAVGVSENYPVVIEGCTVRGNHGGYASAVSCSGTSRTEALTIRDCTVCGNAAEEYGGGAINYMTKAPLVLDGKITMDGNTAADGKALDIRFYYGDATPVTLGPGFESGSTFVLWGSGITPGALLVDAASNGKEADASQFVWKTDVYRTEEKEGNIYLAETPQTYFIGYDVNNNDTGPAEFYIDPNCYTSEDTVAVLGLEGVYPYLGSLEKKGYVFAGWNTRKDGTGTDYAGGEEIRLTENTFLYAKWVAKEPVTLTYIYNGGTGEKGSEQAVPGLEFTFPGAVREGYSFKGWHEDRELAVFAGNAGEGHSVPENDTAYYAAWEKAEATVTFDADGGKMEGGEATVQIGDAIPLPNCTKDGYEFAGWYDGGICIGQAGESYTVTGDVTLKAHYIRKEAQVCIISFDTDGGKAAVSIKAEKGKTVKLPGTEKEGHIFLGWYTAKEGGIRLDAEFTATEDTTLYAHWEKESDKPGERQEATISFDADGGKMEGGDVTAKVGDAITFPGCTKEGYEFTGWYDNDTCAGQAGEKYTVTGDAILKAHYEKKEEAAYTITFDTDGGRETAPIKAAKGEKISLPGTEKPGSAFLGWYTGKTGGILLGIAGDEMEVAKDMTVYALWEEEKAEEAGDGNPETYKVTFHTEGGTLRNESVTIAKGASLYLPLPERDGYDFLGWYLDPSLTQFAGACGDVYRITKDTDFYAKWEGTKGDNNKDGSTDQGGTSETTDTYTVRYDANGGTAKESSAKVAKGASVKLPAAGREGFAFKGWYTDKQAFIGMTGDTYKPDSDISLYARWEKDGGGKDNDGTAEAGNSPDAGAGASADAPVQNEKADAPAAGEPGNTAADVPGTGMEKEPVIQTGHIPPICLLAALGISGVLLAAFSIHEGKRSSGK